MNRAVGMTLLGVLIILMSGCTTYNKEEAVQELEYERIEEDEIPEELLALIERKKAEGFQLTFEKEGMLYIGQGYGEKQQEGYEILVDKCQSSEHFVYFHTILNGPEEEAKEKQSAYPYLVVRCQQRGKQVIFLNH